MNYFCKPSLHKRDFKSKVFNVQHFKIQFSISLKLMNSKNLLKVDIEKKITICKCFEFNYY